MEISFAIYREASANQIYICQGSCEKLPKNIEFRNLSHGFILSPWAKSDELWCISGDIESITENQVLDFLRDFKFQVSETQFSSTAYNEFENAVLSIQNELALGNFEKAVASRIDATSENFDIEKIADKNIRFYKSLIE